MKFFFTHHKNLLYTLSPHRLDTNVARHTVHKTQRWVLRLNKFNYPIEQIPGESNIWADMLTRWAAGESSRFLARRIAMLRVPLLADGLPELHSVQEIAKSKSERSPNDNTEFERTQIGSFVVCLNGAGQLYIPADDTKMQLALAWQHTAASARTLEQQPQSKSSVKRPHGHPWIRTLTHSFKHVTSVYYPKVAIRSHVY